MKKLILLLIIFISCSSESGTPAVEIIESETTTIGVEMNDKTYTNEHPMTIDVSKKYTALIKTNLGDIEVEFFTTDAPKTVNNFITLSKDGYYDNVIFHRVISGFMIQGGDPSGTGHGDYGKYPGYEFEDELNNQVPYSKGILAMANRGPNTNGSQFFIMHVDYPLPYNYTIFGKVVDGLEVVDKIASVQTDSSDKPLDDVTISTVEILEN
ncbi:MAG: peptidylprolyl isomerase [Actinomycetota bacterium]|nr:peptidylprolyl isomerase [Actinomycetota bacterium]MDA3013773.1 peptidylprolyl isomerase [Actinomycetota bacterium]